MKTFLHTHYFYTLVGVTVLVLRIPFIGKILRVANTMVHESGHAFMALFTSGSVVSIDLFHDTSGTAVTKSSTWISKFLVALSGYFASSVIAYLLFALLKEGRHVMVAYLLMGLALLNIIFWVRNAYGLLWLLGFVGINAWLIYAHNAIGLQASAIVFSTAILAESLISALIILYLSFMASEKSGDAKNLKDFTGIPAAFWGLLFCVQACYFFYLTAKLIIT